MLPPTYVEGFHDLEEVKKMTYRPFGNTGLLVSKLGLGGAAYGVHYDAFDEDEAIETIRQALKRGVNYIDTAPFYGQGKSERIIGKALKGVPRQAYYIATKVGRYELDAPRMFDFSKEKTRSSFTHSLELLGLDYVDILQIHDIDFTRSRDIILTQTLPEIAKIVGEGKAKHVGITAYNYPQLREVIEKSSVKIETVLSYARLTLLDDSLLAQIPYFNEHKIAVINAAAPAQGLLTNQGAPAWQAADANVKAVCAEAGKYCKEQGVELGNLAVWYSLQFENVVATNIIGIQNLKLLNTNLNIAVNGLSDKEKEVLAVVKEKYLSKLTSAHWEGVEPQNYFNALEK